MIWWRYRTTPRQKTYILNPMLKYPMPRYSMLWLRKIYKILYFISLRIQLNNTWYVHSSEWRFTDIWIRNPLAAILLILPWYFYGEIFSNQFENLDGLLRRGYSLPLWLTPLKFVFVLLPQNEEHFSRGRIASPKLIKQRLVTMSPSVRKLGLIYL